MQTNAQFGFGRRRRGKKQPKTQVNTNPGVQQPVSPIQEEEEPSWFNVLWRASTDKNSDYPKVVQDWQSGKPHKMYGEPTSWLERALNTIRRF